MTEGAMAALRKSTWSFLGEIFLSGKQNSCYFATKTPRWPGQPPRSPSRSKKFGNDTFSLDLLQSLEIPQNHQSFLWKSLAVEPHFFGKAGQKFGGRAASASRLYLRRRVTAPSLDPRFRGDDIRPPHLIGGAYCKPPWVHSAFSPRRILIGEPMPTLRSNDSP